MKPASHLAICCVVATFLLTFSAFAKADVRIHEVLIDDNFSTPLNDNSEPVAFNLQLSAMGRDLVLNLTPSKLNTVANLNGINDQDLPFWYEGTVEGDAQSWVRIGMEENQPSGHLYHDGKLLKLENSSSIEGLNASTGNNNSLILIEPSTAIDAAPLLKSASFLIDKEVYAPEYKLSDKAAFQTKNLAPANTSRIDIGIAVTRAIRVGIVIDSRFNDEYNGRGLAQALSIMNSVDGIYQSQLGIAVLIEAIRVYDDPITDPMRNDSSDIGQILDNFRPIRQADARLPADLTLVHLFSGHKDPDRIIGLSLINAACRLDGYDLSMSTPFPYDTLLAAHEMAHNLGAVHDDNPLCEADVNLQPNMLMWPELTSTSTEELSSCSINSIQASKYADCNIDNIDVAVQMRALPSSEFLRRSVIVETTNNDLYQRGTDVVSNTAFPFGTTISDISAGCSVNGVIVSCNHGTIQAQSTHSVSMTATLLDPSVENIETTLVLLNATDVDDEDNRAVIQLLTFDENAGQTISAISPIPADDASFNGNGPVSAGSVSTTVISALLLLLSRSINFGLRRRFRLLFSPQY